MAGTLTQAAFVQRVLRRLSEAANSPSGNFETGAGGPPVLTTSQAITDYANEGVSILCRTCWPVIRLFTASPSAPTQYLSYADLAVGSPSYTAWQALQGGVSWTPNGGAPSPLLYCSEAALASRYPGYQNLPAGNPTNWFRRGADGIGLFVAAAANIGNVTLNGMAVLPVASLTGPMYPDLPDDILSPTVETYVCAMIAAVNSQDATLGNKAGLWMAQFEGLRRQLHDRIDPAMALMFPDLMPINIAITPNSAVDAQGTDS